MGVSRFRVQSRGSRLPEFTLEKPCFSPRFRFKRRLLAEIVAHGHAAFQTKYQEQQRIRFLETHFHMRQKA